MFIWTLIFKKEVDFVCNKFSKGKNVQYIYETFNFMFIRSLMYSNYLKMNSVLYITLDFMCIGDFFVSSTSMNCIISKGLVTYKKKK